MKQDAFSRCHPAVNFLFFLGAICCGAVIQHPAYLIAGWIGSAAYYLVLKGKKGLSFLLGLIPMICLIGGLNPLINTQGKFILFSLFGRPYTLQALCYGLALGSILGIMLLWFGCASVCLTNDKFTALFGNLIPALSLLLVMILRLIPGLTRKAGQISAARGAIGKGTSANAGLKQKLLCGGANLSALTDWALEGSVITSDSMLARGYGVGKRMCFQLYRMTRRDWVLLAVMTVLLACVLLSGGTEATYTPRLYADYVGIGFVAYCLFLLIPTALDLEEALKWRYWKSEI